MPAGNMGDHVVASGGGFGPPSANPYAPAGQVYGDSARGAASQIQTGPSVSRTGTGLRSVPVEDDNGKTGGGGEVGDVQMSPVPTEPVGLDAVLRTSELAKLDGFHWLFKDNRLSEAESHVVRQLLPRLEQSYNREYNAADAALTDCKGLRVSLDEANKKVAKLEKSVASLAEDKKARQAELERLRRERDLATAALQKECEGTVCLRYRVQHLEKACDNYQNMFGQAFSSAMSSLASRAAIAPPAPGSSLVSTALTPALLDTDRVIDTPPVAAEVAPVADPAPRATSVKGRTPRVPKAINKPSAPGSKRGGKGGKGGRSRPQTRASAKKEQKPEAATKKGDALAADDSSSEDVMVVEEDGSSFPVKDLAKELTKASERADAAKARADAYAKEKAVRDAAAKAVQDCAPSASRDTKEGEPTTGKSKGGKPSDLTSALPKVPRRGVDDDVKVAGDASRPTGFSTQRCWI